LVDEGGIADADVTPILIDGSPELIILRQSVYQVPLRRHGGLVPAWGTDTVCGMTGAVTR